MGPRPKGELRQHLPRMLLFGVIILLVIYNILFSSESTLSGFSKTNCNTDSIITEHVHARTTMFHKNWQERVRYFGVLIDHEVEDQNILMNQAFHYAEIAMHLAPDSVVCEAGFFQGVSAHLWLSATPGSTKLYSFDLEFPSRNVEVLREFFGASRLVTTQESTRNSLPEFQPTKPCSLLSIDGDHNDWNPYQDLVDFLPNTMCGSPVLFDDTFFVENPQDKELNNEATDPKEFFNFCSRSYWRAVNEGLIDHEYCIEFGTNHQWGKYPKGFCKAIARKGGCVEKD